jgi:hypothetical protein
VNHSEGQQGREGAHSDWKKYMVALNDLICVNPFDRLTEILANNVQVEKVGRRLITRRSDAQSCGITYAQYLDEQDIRRIRECVRGVTIQSIIPWMEARVREWKETFEMSRNGITSRLFAASKNFFGSVKPGNLATAKQSGDAREP